MHKSRQISGNQRPSTTVTMTTHIEQSAWLLHGADDDDWWAIERYDRHTAAAGGAGLARIDRTGLHAGRRRGHAGLGTLLAAIALVLLVAVAVAFVRALLGATLPDHAVELLEQILLILMIVELLYTVQVSFREHALVPEPFLIVGLLAAIRRLLVLTAEFAPLLQKNDGAFHGAMLELGLLTVMIVAFVVSLVVLKKQSVHGVGDRAPG